MLYTVCVCVCVCVRVCVCACLFKYGIAVFLRSVLKLTNTRKLSKSKTSKFVPTSTWNRTIYGKNYERPPSPFGRRGSRINDEK